jgi:hypothetical protein
MPAAPFVAIAQELPCASRSSRNTEVIVALSDILVEGVANARLGQFNGPATARRRGGNSGRIRLIGPVEAREKDRRRNEHSVHCVLNSVDESTDIQRLGLNLGRP